MTTDNTNAERQRNYRHRYKEMSKTLQYKDWIDIETNSDRYGAATLAMLLHLACKGTSKVEKAEDRLNLDLTSDHVDLLAPHVRQWIDEATLRLWKADEPVRFKIQIQAIVDPRRKETMTRRIERERGAGGRQPAA
jgi:hypothetical protein